MSNKDDFISLTEKLKSIDGNLKSLYELIYKTSPEKAYIEYENGNEIYSLTYKEYDQLVHKMANFFSKKLNSVEKGKWIALKEENCREWFAYLWGLLMAGYKVVLIDYKHDYDVTKRLLEKSGAKAIVTNERDKNDYGILKVTLEKNIEEYDSQFKEYFENAIAICTSGTTSNYNIFAYSGNEFKHQLMVIKEVYDNNNKFFDLENGDKALIMIPLHHIFSLITAFATTIGGAVHVYPDKINVKTILRYCQTFKITMLCSVPIFWNNVVRSIKNAASQDGEKLKDLQVLKQEVFGSDFRIGINGGGYIESQTLEFLKNMNCTILNGYGSTEAGIISVSGEYDANDKDNATVGKIFSNVEYKIESGELFLKHKYMHAGILKEGKIIGKKVDEDGWYHTGDIVKELDGKIYLKGRIKEIIINESGENIFPDEIAYKFKNIDNCSFAEIIGIKNESLSEDVGLVLNSRFAYDDENKNADIVSQFNAINKTLPMFERVKKLYITNSLNKFSMKVSR
ncbi:AMP-binding protein, partial [uncultured Clostridium sp.]